MADHRWRQATLTEARENMLNPVDYEADSQLDFGQFMQRERAHFPFGTRHDVEFLRCCGLAGT